VFLFYEEKDTYRRYEFFSLSLAAYKNNIIMKETKPYDLPKEGPKNKVSEPDSKEYILTGLKEAFLEMKEVKARRSQSRPAEELLKELMEERDEENPIE
jgi:hypothetical protein